MHRLPLLQSSLLRQQQGEVVQGIQFALAEMECETEAARLTVYNAARLKDAVELLLTAAQAFLVGVLLYLAVGLIVGSTGQ